MRISDPAMTEPILKNEDPNSVRRFEVTAEVHDQTSSTEPENFASLSDEDSSISEASVEAGGVDISLTKLKPASLLTFQVNMQGIEREALIDSGATISLVQANMVRDRELNPVSSTICGLGGSCTESMGSVSLRFHLGSLEFEEIFTVVPDETIGCDLILGDSFLTRYGVSIDYNASKIEGTLDGGHFVCYRDALDLDLYSLLPVYLTKDHLSSPGATDLVEVSLLRNGKSRFNLNTKETFFDAAA